MDFTFSPEADEAAGLTAELLGKRVTAESLKAVDAGADRYDHELWQDLAEAGLLSLSVPEEHGGAGLGLLESLRVLVELGRVVAPVPAAVQARLRPTRPATPPRAHRCRPGRYVALPPRCCRR